MTVGALPSREQAIALLHEWIQNPNLRKHCYAVEAAMRAYARRDGEDEERWGLTGLVHDFDWERHPDAERHPMKGVEVLRAAGWPETCAGRSWATPPTAASRATRAWRAGSSRATSCADSWWHVRS